MFTHHFGQKKYEFVTKTSENVQLVAKKNGNCPNKTYTFYNFFQSVKASYGWLQKKTGNCQKKFCQILLNFYIVYFLIKEPQHRNLHPKQS
jgi:hypothetical protein